MGWVGPLFKQLMWSVLRLIFCGVRGISWHMRGISTRQRLNKKNGAYKRIVQCLKVIGRYKMDLLLQPSGPDNFLLIHDSWTDPESVLDDTVTLYYVTKNEAVFVRCPPQVNPASSNYSPFIKIGQFQHATHVLVMPIHVFHKLAEEVGDPKGDLVFLSNMGRCGSTLLCQVFEESQKAISLSEPDAVIALTSLRDLPTEKYDQMVRNIIRLLCKPTQYMPGCKLWLVKIAAPAMDFVPYLTQVFPNCKNIYMYRDGMAKCKALDYDLNQSGERLSHVLPMFDMLIFLGSKSGKMTQRIMLQMMGFPIDNFKVKVTSRLAFSAMMWGSSIARYRDLRAKGVEISAVRYEDLVSEPIYAVSRIFEYVGLSQELVQQAVDNGMNKDSQRHWSPLSRDNLRRNPNEEYTPEIKANCDEISEKFNLPKLDEPCVLEGTITNKDLELQNAKSS